VAVNFNDDTWRYIEAKLQEGLKKQQSLLHDYDTSYKDLLRAQGATTMLRNLLLLPQESLNLAATKSRK